MSNNTQWGNQQNDEVKLLDQILTWLKKLQDSLSGGLGTSIGSTVTGGTATRVLFSDTGSVLADDAGLTYNSTTNTLTIGQSLVVTGSTTAAGSIVLGEDADNGSNTTSIFSAANLAANRTIVLPSAAPTNGYFVQTDGSGNWTYASAGLSAPLTYPIRTHTAAGAVTVTTADHIVIVNKSSGAATTVNLPGSPTTGHTYVIKDGKGDANVNNITITPAAGNIDGGATYVVSIAYQCVTCIYNGSEWSII